MENEKTEQGNSVGQKEKIFDLALGRFEFFKGEDEDAYYKDHKAGGKTLERVSSAGFRLRLFGEFKRKFGIIPGSSAVEDAIRAIEFEACEREVVTQIFRRYGYSNGKIYCDLDGNNYVEICSEGFSIIKEPPVYFTRSKGMAPLPLPDQVGEISHLWEILGIKEDALKALIGGAVLGFMNPTIHASALGLEGPQGSGKSFAAKIIKALVDPEVHDLRALPSNEQALAILCKGRWLLAFDNLSGIHPWAQDALCRIITGASFSCRKLYTSDEEVNIKVHNPVLMNGIDDMATRPDLAERSIVVNLPQIPSSKRRQEAELLAEFKKNQAAILGGFYKALAMGLKNRATVKLRHPPRMSDFAHFVTAAETALGIQHGGFMIHYGASQEATNAANLESFPAVTLLATWITEKQFDNRMEGTSSELLRFLETETKDRWDLKKHPSWPKTAHQLSNQIKRAIPLFAAKGICVIQHRTKERRAWCLWIEKTGDNLPSQASPDALSGDNGDSHDEAQKAWEAANGKEDSCKQSSAVIVNSRTLFENPSEPKPFGWPHK